MKKYATVSGKGAKVVQITREITALNTSLNLLFYTKKKKNVRTFEFEIQLKTQVIL